MSIPVQDAKPTKTEPKAKAESEAEQWAQIPRPGPVSQILIDRADMVPGEFLEKYPDYPIGDPFDVLRWLTQLARDALSSSPPADEGEKLTDGGEAAQLWSVLLQVAADNGYKCVANGESEFDFLQDLVRRGALSMKRS